MKNKILGIFTILAFLGVGVFVFAQSDVIEIGEIAKIYQPTKFGHKAHVDIGLECKKCHHTGDQKKCSECHKAEAGAEGDPIKLKDAYHKQCKGCHTEQKQAGKNAPTSCTACHAKKTE